MRAETIPASLMSQAETRPYAPAYYIKQGGAWRSRSWKAYVSEVRQTARALLAHGFKPGDKVAQLGFNCPEWVIFHLAAMCCGGAGVGVYTTCSAEEVQYVVHHAEARFLFVDSHEQWRKIDAERENLPLLEYVVLTRDVEAVDDPMVLTWEAFHARAEEADEARLDERIDALEPSGLASLIYTSGTTGPPKGVMLTHENVAWTAKLSMELVESSEGDCSLSYLPLSHIAEQNITVYGPTISGASIYYAESIDKVADNLREVQPTLIFGVPRIWEKFYAGVSARLSEAAGVKAALLGWARGVASKVHEARNRGAAPSPLTELQYGLAQRLVFSKLKTALGLSRANMCVSGAAPISKEILEFFASLDVVIREIYGQSEDTGPTSFNLPGKTKFGTVGVPLPGVSVKLGDDDEILVKGKNVFPGYYKDSDASAEALTDGWLHSGDLGSFDEDGFLVITGRKKDIIITAGGKNVAPKNIEAALKNSQLINEAVVIGDRRKYLSALVTLDPEAVAKFLQTNGIEPSPVDQIPALQEEVQAIVDEVNTHLAKVETIKKFAILRENLSVENGELTPTLKVKRKVVGERHAEVIESLYKDA